ncbi:bacteriohemerythrin [Insolitispirillum peregrinum]|uniref:Hemerythrin n=1 Tax=Insolitispirillum peregrinum TaxID=80876 RepID=A0A1N7L3Y3_9PROT|nr:hemerythrin family protein [Insolitispirillum peregrinum]SIS68476.1 hemerythrin [Insolitispirillum peregrinum]
MSLRPTASEPQTLSIKSFLEGHHRGLRQKIDHIAQSCRALPADQMMIAESLAALQVFAATHFADEEKLMDDVHYPDRGSHHHQHRHFLDLIRDLQTTVSQDGLSDGMDVPGQIAAWWEQHSVIHDRALVDFLCRGGI